MLFRRRTPLTVGERLRAALWPRRSWRRSLRYGLRRLQRLGDATPHALALGVAIGVFASFQPILGFQMLLAGVLAWLLGASVGAALVGTFVGTPATWPLMWAASFGLGAAVLGEARYVTIVDLWKVATSLGAAASPGSPPIHIADSLLWGILRPLAVGAVPLGLLSAALFYVIVMRALRVAGR
jgi:uncharacterized protein